MGNRSSDVLETKEPRQFSVIFQGPERDTDTFEITLPAGYEVDDLPPPIDMDYSFSSYHSKTEASGNVLKYSRTFEIKELSVPLSKMDDLKKFYRVIAGDERTNYGHELHHLGGKSFKQYVLEQDNYDPARFHLLGLIACVENVRVSAGQPIGAIQKPRSESAPALPLPRT